MPTPYSHIATTYLRLVGVTPDSPPVRGWHCLFDHPTSIRVVPLICIDRSLRRWRIVGVGSEPVPTPYPVPDS